LFLRGPGRERVGWGEREREEGEWRGEGGRQKLPKTRKTIVFFNVFSVGPNRLQEGPKTQQHASKTLQDAPRRLQDGSKTLQDAS
jgi:hypothetical protein